MKRLKRCRVVFDWQHPEGVSASDFKKLEKLFGFVHHSLRAIRELPSTEIAFPATKWGASHMHPAIVFMENFLFAGQQFCEQQHAKKN